MTESSQGAAELQEIRDALIQLGAIINAHAPQLRRLELDMQQLNITVRELCARPPPVRRPQILAVGRSPVPTLPLLCLPSIPPSPYLYLPPNHSLGSLESVGALCFSAPRYSSTKHVSSLPNQRGWATSSLDSRDRPWSGQPPSWTASCPRQTTASCSCIV